MLIIFNLKLKKCFNYYKLNIVLKIYIFLLFILHINYSLLSCAILNFNLYILKIFFDIILKICVYIYIAVIIKNKMVIQIFEIL